MGKVAVIYAGKYGSTKQYAQWICQETGGDLYAVSDCSAADLVDYDTVIFGGAIHAGGILGIDKLKKLYPFIADKQVLTFAVGLNTESEEARRECRELNFTKQEIAFKKILRRIKGGGRKQSAREVEFSQLPCWFFRGAYDPGKVSGTDKAMMGVVKKMIAGKRPSEVTQSERELLRAIEEGADYMNRDCIRELIKAING